MTIFQMAIRTLGFGLLVTGISTMALQPLTCDEVAIEAITAANEACLALEENQVCYGHPEVLAELSDPLVTFEEVGDRVPSDTVITLSTSPYNAETNTWGIAYVRVVNADGTEILIMLFGGATLVNDADGLRVEIVEDTSCVGTPSGIIVSASDVTEITVNGETFPVTQVPTALTVNVGELEALILGGEGSELPDDGSLENLPSSVVESFTLVLGSDASAIQTFESTSSATLTPTTGTWYNESSSATLISACAGEFTGSPRRPPAESWTAEFDFSDGISVEAFIMQLMGRVPPAEFANPAPNIYTAQAEIGGEPAELTLTVVSETEMVYSLVFYQVRCRVQAIDWWMLQDE
jgi:hypothetical protein